MNCPTCHIEIRDAVHFCPHCGWPAGRLEAVIPGNAIGVPDASQAQIPLIVRNIGAGQVEYEVSVKAQAPWAFLSVPGVPRGLAIRDRRLLPGEEDNGLRVGVDGAALPPDVDHLNIEINSSDRGGVNAAHYRPWSVAKNRRRTWTVTVPIRRLGGAQIRVAQSLVVLTQRRREGRITIENTGGAQAEVSVTGLPESIHGAWEQPAAPVAQDVLDVSFDDPREPQAPLGNAASPYVIPAESSVTLVVSADDDFSGKAELQICQGDARHPVTIYAETGSHWAGVVKHWTVGIDFGTAKSAVFYTDNWVAVEKRLPQPIMWPISPDAPERNLPTTRSAVMYTRGMPVPRCGHNVVVSAGFEGDNERIIDSIKTRLRDDGADTPLDMWGSEGDSQGPQVTAIDVVAEFMQYLMDEVRATGPFRGQVGMDARLVLTLPVLEDAASFKGQRDRTLRAARTAGLDPEDLLTPTEPECAALDLMHSLRRGDYTWDGQTYQLQDREVLMVLDCGAGTTDVAVLRVLLSNGSYQAEQIASAGYRFGGDTVDDLILSWILDQQADRVRFGFARGRPLLQPEGLQRPMHLQAAREECRRVKESLFAPGASQQPRAFHTDLGEFTVAPEDVSRLVLPFLQSMFTNGRMPDPAAFFPSLAQKLDTPMREALWRDWAVTAGTKIRTMQTMLREAGLRKHDVSFLFVTGGTGQIPVIATEAYKFMGRGLRTLRALPEDCTVNVARGAALYYDYHFSGALPCEVLFRATISASDEEITEPVFPRGALPGVTAERAVRVGPRDSLELALVGDCSPDGPSGNLVSHVVTNSSADFRQVIASVTYGSDRVLRWGIRFTDGQVALPEATVLQT